MGERREAEERSNDVCERNAEELFRSGREAGEDAVGEIVSAVPGLAQFV